MDRTATTGHEADDQSPLSKVKKPALCWVFPRSLEEPTELGRHLVIGREATADVVLPGSEVSRRHAEVWQAGPLFLIRDLGSKNGVYLNGKAVDKAELQPGDVVRIGEWLGVFAWLPTSQRVSFAEQAPSLFGGPGLAFAIAQAKHAAQSGLPIVVEGETGTGKEVFARAIHTFSGRTGPFLAVNCAGYSETIAAAELFGYRKGAFTGADQGHPGHIRAAQGGTLMLDEVIELPQSVQAQLLRVLQEREVLPLGEVRATPIDVRFVAAAQRPLAAAAAENGFRTDLRARLEGLVLCIPPLRERPTDLVPLFLHLLRKAAGDEAPRIDVRFAEALHAHDWPMNVRELSVVVQRLLVLRSGKNTLRVEDLMRVLPEQHDAPPDAQRKKPEPKKVARGRSAKKPYSDEEIEQLVKTLAAEGGNVSRAAAALNMTRQKAYRMLEFAQSRK